MRFLTATLHISSDFGRIGFSPSCSHIGATSKSIERYMQADHLYHRRRNNLALNGMEESLQSKAMSTHIPETSHFQ
jgi:hypothetical protein